MKTESPGITGFSNKWIIKQANLLPGDTVIVKNAEYINESYLQIKVTEKLPENIDKNSVLENISWNASVTMKQCAVRQNRARSVRFSTHGKILVENNYFSSMMAGILTASDRNYWCEPGAVYDMTVRINAIDTKKITIEANECFYHDNE